ncbi:hypothetical protein [Thalassovita sp.]|jgi:hypothetical protein|uniref:hypothetical protein n=1 Tax=Thalassovita sp. TaxID=1979401 RepID=UPI003B5B1AC6
MLRFLAVIFLLLGLSACANPNDLDQPPVDLGAFKLGHNIVVAPKATKGPVSRDASAEEWVASLTEAMAERFGRYEGERLVHFGISVEGFVLAQPGIPVVASPKSVLIINLTVWDDKAGAKLNEKPQQITVLESFSGKSFVGSGLTQSKEEQMLNLSRNAAKQVEEFLVRMHAEEGWFAPSRPADEALDQG